MRRLLTLWARHCLSLAQFYAEECWGRQQCANQPATDGWDARAPRDKWYRRYDAARALLAKIEGEA